MKLKTWQLGSAVTLGLLTLSGGSALRSTASVQQGPVWLSDYSTAQKIARASGKPLFVAFR